MSNFEKMAFGEYYTPPAEQQSEQQTQTEAKPVEQPQQEIKQEVQATTPQPVEQQTPVEIPMNAKLEELQPPQLIEEIKKWQRIAEERKVENEKNLASINDIRNFINESKENFWGAYKKYSQVFGLPDYELVIQDIRSNRTPEEQLMRYKEELKRHIEKKYNIEEFEYDPADEFEIGTPSYEWIRSLREKEAEIYTKYREEARRNEELLNAFKRQVELDREEVKKTYFNYENGEQEFQQLYEEFNKPKDEVDVTNHPLSFKTIFRGYYFDKLVERIVNNKIAEIHKQYNDLGLYLPKTKELPPDVTNIKGTEPQTQPMQVVKNSFSPAFNSLSKYL